MNRSKGARCDHIKWNGHVLLFAFPRVHHANGLVLWSFSVSWSPLGTCCVQVLTDLRRPIGKISMDDRSGDFIEHSGPVDINLRTFFHFRKPLPPRLDPCVYKKAVPPQPLPVDYSTMGWLWGTGPITGAQLDALGKSAHDRPAARPHLRGQARDIGESMIADT